MFEIQYSTVIKILDKSLKKDDLEKLYFAMSKMKFIKN